MSTSVEIARAERIREKHEAEFLALAKSIADGEKASAEQIEAVSTAAGKKPSELEWLVKRLAHRRTLRQKAAQLEPAEKRVEECQALIAAANLEWHQAAEKRDRIVAPLEKEIAKLRVLAAEARTIPSELMVNCPCKWMQEKRARLSREREEIGNEELRVRDEIEKWNVARDQGDAQEKEKAISRIKRLEASLVEIQNRGAELERDEAENVADMIAY
jgi:hypothetical protein